jgi:hypothetical protein
VTEEQANACRPIPVLDLGEQFRLDKCQQGVGTALDAVRILAWWKEVRIPRSRHVFNSDYEVPRRQIRPIESSRHLGGHWAIPAPI